MGCKNKICFPDLEIKGAFLSFYYFIDQSHSHLTTFAIHRVWIIKSVILHPSVTFNTVKK